MEDSHMNKAFVMQMRVKKMAEKYQEEHPELSEKEVMEAVVLKKKKKKDKESENNQEKNVKEETDLEELLEDIPEAD